MLQANVDMLTKATSKNKKISVTIFSLYFRDLNSLYDNFNTQPFEVIGVPVCILKKVIDVKCLN